MIAIHRPRNPDEVYEDLAEANPEAMVADGFEDAYIGYTIGVAPSVAIYDFEKCVEVLMARDELSREDAIEYLNFNTVYAYVGKGTPLFLIRAEND